MAQGAELLEQELRELGFDPTRNGDRVAFAYEIPVGKLMGTTVTVGFVIPPDFARTPPGGPHVSGRLAGTQGLAPGGRATNVSGSDFGTDFEYWSRPYRNWGRDGRSTQTYMAFLRKLFAET